MTQKPEKPKLPLEEKIINIALKVIQIGGLAGGGGGAVWQLFTVGDISKAIATAVIGVGISYASTLIQPIHREKAQDANNDSKKAEAQKILKYLVYGLNPGLVGTLLYSFQAPDLGKFFSAMSVACMIACSALAVGVFVGFLFGLPRTLQSGVLPEKQELKSSENMQISPTNYKVNTNLEEISDWLTKIIVGIGLTQIPSIIQFFKDYSNYVKVNSPSELTNSNVFALALVIYFLIYGFLSGYLWTRLGLSGAFIVADKELSEISKKVEDIVEDINNSNANDAKCLKFLSRYLDVSLNLSNRQEDELEGLIKKASIKTRFQIFEHAQKALYQNRLNPKIYKDDPYKDEPMKKVVVENALNVFKILHDSDEKKDNDRYPAHVAYAHLALGNDYKNLAEAKTHLAKAVEILEHNPTIQGSEKEFADQDLIVYESNLVICKLKLEINRRNINNNLEELRKLTDDNLEELRKLKHLFDDSENLKSLEEYNIADKVKKLISNCDLTIEEWAKDKINLATLEHL